MKFSAEDFPLIRWSVLAICSSALVSALMLVSSGKYADKTQSDLQNAQRTGNDARNRLSAAYEDKENMSIYADEFGKLIERKIIGDDQRLDWIEGLEKLRKQNLVTDFKYNIAPQKIYAPQPAIAGGNFDIHYSEMKLYFDLLHEEQLLNFLTALRLQNIGWYQLDSCTLKRNANESTDAATQTQLRAECTGGWVTLKNRNAKS
jgi:hypothetical protein